MGSTPIRSIVMETFLDLCYNCFSLGIEADTKKKIDKNEIDYFNFIQWARESKVTCSDNECIIFGPQLEKRFDIKLKKYYAIGMKHIIANSTFLSIKVVSYSLEEKNGIAIFKMKFKK